MRSYEKKNFLIWTEFPRQPRKYLSGRRGNILPYERNKWFYFVKIFPRLPRKFYPYEQPLKTLWRNRRTTIFFSIGKTINILNCCTVVYLCVCIFAWFIILQLILIVGQIKIQTRYVFFAFLNTKNREEIIVSYEKRKSTKRFNTSA